MILVLEKLSIAELSRQTRVSKDTLRNWSKRYDFPSALREPNGHRSYLPTEIDKVRIVKKLIDEGMTTREAISAARSGLGAASKSAQDLYNFVDSHEMRPDGLPVNFEIEHISQRMLKSGQTGTAQLLLECVNSQFKLSRACFVQRVAISNELRVLDSYDQLAECNSQEDKMGSGYRCFVNPQSSVFAVGDQGFRISPNLNAIRTSYSKNQMPEQRSIRILDDRGHQASLWIPVFSAGHVAGGVFLNSTEPQIFSNDSMHQKWSHLIPQIRALAAQMLYVTDTRHNWWVELSRSIAIKEFSGCNFSIDRFHQALSQWYGRKSEKQVIFGEKDLEFISSLPIFTAVVATTLDLIEANGRILFDLAGNYLVGTIESKTLTPKALLRRANLESIINSVGYSLQATNNQLQVLIPIDQDYSTVNLYSTLERA